MVTPARTDGNSEQVDLVEVIQSSQNLQRAKIFLDGVNIGERRMRKGKKSTRCRRLQREEILLKTMNRLLNMPSLCLCVLSRVHMLSRVCLFAASGTVAHQAPLSMKFSRQQYWSGLPVPPPGHPLYPETEPTSLASPTSAGVFFTTVPPGKTMKFLINAY